MRCIKCGAPLAQPDTGRPKTYCSTVCRRAAEFEIRRIVRRIETMELALRNARADRSGIRDLSGRTSEQYADVLSGHIAEDEGRLRELLAAAG